MRRKGQHEEQMQRLRSQWAMIAELKEGWSAYSGKGNGLALDEEDG